MGRTYNIVFNSDIASSGNNSIQNFFYDWTKLEQGQYKCSFSMVCSVGSPPTFNVNVGIFMDLGQSQTFIACPSNSGVFGAGYLSPSYIGTLGVNTLQNNVYAYSNLEDNPPFYLQKRPPNNSVQVGLYLVTNTSTQISYNPPLIGRYTLNLHLEKID